MIVFLINLSIQYTKYQELIDEEIYETKAKVINIYKKEDYNVIKLQNSNIDFFTSVSKDELINKNDVLNIVFITSNISFVKYLKGFYTNTIYFNHVNYTKTIKDKISQNISNQHENPIIKELFQALFLAIPISQELRQICTNYGISHLIALSGFHLAVLSFLIYWILYYPYNFIHQRYFPFRNKKYDLILISIAFLFIYLIFTNMVASLLRAFVMFVIGIYLLRTNIKIFSFLNLFIVLLIILAMFPKYIFSLSLWFSMFGVFYIFLYINYFKDIKSKVFQVVFFNFWIYFVMNPIVHYFFHNVTYEQLLSPFITLAFTLFYPSELLLHILGVGYSFDTFIEYFLSYEFTVFQKQTHILFFALYILFSFLSIFSKNAFIFLNILICLFTGYLFLY
ncbi:MAG: ComEC/Rec2 family competence protein [Poseidonibacter sp.]|uniref:ComEC/Rec2 family competence protein n=1 Tax=Poseidonibacter sp. TaxID=2321188 RepID=UPI00359E9BF6